MPIITAVQPRLALHFDLVPRSSATNADAAFLDTVADWLLTWYYTRYTGRTAERLLFALRIRIFAHLQRLGLDYYDREMAGRVMTRMTNDVDTLSNLLQVGLINALVSTLSLVGVLVVMLVVSPQLTLAVLTIMPPLLFFTVWFRRRSRRAYEQARDLISTVNAEFQENLSGIRVAQAYTRENRNIDSFRATSNQWLRARVTAQRLQAIYFPLIQFFSTCAAAIVLGYGGMLVHEGAITAPTVILFLLYLDQFFSPIQQLSQIFEQWQQASVALGRIDELMQTATTTPEAEHPVHVGRDARRDQLRGRPLRVPEHGTGDPARRERRHHAGRDRRVGRHDRRGQVDDREAGRAVLRRDRRRGPHRRRAGHRSRPRRVPSPARVRAPGAVPVLGHHPRQHRVRAPGGDRCRGRGSGAGGGRARVRRGACAAATSTRSPSGAVRCRRARSS